MFERKAVPCGWGERVRSQGAKDRVGELHDAWVASPSARE